MARATLIQEVYKIESDDKEFSINVFINNDDNTVTIHPKGNNAYNGVFKFVHSDSMTVKRAAECLKKIADLIEERKEFEKIEK